MPDVSSFDSQSNPYAVTQETLVNDGILAEGELERIRNNCIEQEKSIQGLGRLFSGLGWLSLAVALNYVSKTLPGGEGLGERARILLIVCGSYGVLSFVIAFGLEKLRNWARILAALLTLPGLILFPFVTVIAAYALYLLISEKGCFVCSQEYHSVIKATPHIQGHTPLLLKIVFYSLFAVFIGGVILMRWLDH